MGLVVRALNPVWIAMVAWVAGARLAGAQSPSHPDTVAAIEKSRAVALAYAQSLPDFLCTEVISRFADPRRHGEWSPTDTLTIQLSYFSQKEEHKLTLIDGTPTNLPYESLGGAIGVGEFGTTLHNIFDPAAEARFHWDGWKNVRKHRAAVYSYVVEPSHSRFYLAVRAGTGWRYSVAGLHGVVAIDYDTGAVLHFSYDADHIPKGIEIEASSSSVVYDYADVGGRDYLLPATADTVVRSPGSWARNHAEFREYRKFSSESNVNFGADK
jgi:hypothetical protein